MLYFLDDFKDCLEGKCSRCDSKGNMQPLTFGSSKVEWKGKEIIRCPLRSCNGFNRCMVIAHAHYKNQQLPHSGGVLEQDNKIMQAINVLSSVEKEVAEMKKPKTTTGTINNG